VYDIVADDVRVMAEENFGPIAAITSFASEMADGFEMEIRAYVGNKGF